MEKFSKGELLIFDSDSFKKPKEVVFEKYSEKRNGVCHVYFKRIGNERNVLSVVNIKFLRRKTLQ